MLISTSFFADVKRTPFQHSQCNRVCLHTWSWCILSGQTQKASGDTSLLHKCAINLLPCCGLPSAHRVPSTIRYRAYLMKEGGGPHVTGGLAIITDILTGSVCQTQGGHIVGFYNNHHVLLGRCAVVVWPLEGRKGFRL